MVNLGEPALSQNIRFLYEGRLPWRELSRPPFSLVPYGPAYLILAAFLKMFVAAPFWGGRLIGGAASVGLAVLIFAYLRRWEVCTLLAFFLALFFVNHPFIGRWGFQVNVDMTAVFFSFLSFFFFDAWIRKNFEKKLFWFLGVVFGVVAFFTKSSAISGCASLMLYLLLVRRFRLFFLSAVIMGAAILAIYTLLNFLTHGQYYFHTTYEISKRLFFPELFLRYWTVAFQESWLLVLASVLFLAYCLIKKKHLLPGLYLFISACLTISLGKQGSDSNYLLEWCVVSVLALAQGASAQNRWLRTTALILCLAQLSIWVVARPPFQKMASQFQENMNFYEALTAQIRKVPGEILSEDMGILVASGKEIQYEPFPMGQMSYSGVWDQSRIINKLNRKDFDLAILYFYAPALKANRTFTPEFMEAFKKNYHYVGRLAYPWDKSRNPQSLYFYVPNK